jgi:hypothetical protein
MFDLSPEPETVKVDLMQGGPGVQEQTTSSSMPIKEEQIKFFKGIADQSAIDNLF